MRPTDAIELGKKHGAVMGFNHRKEDYMKDVMVFIIIYNFIVKLFWCCAVVLHVFTF